MKPLNIFIIMLKVHLQGGPLQHDYNSDHLSLFHGQSLCPNHWRNRIFFEKFFIDLRENLSTRIGVSHRTWFEIGFTWIMSNGKIPKAETSVQNYRPLKYRKQKRRNLKRRKEKCRSIAFVPIHISRFHLQAAFSLQLSTITHRQPSYRQHHHHHLHPHYHYHPHPQEK